MDGWVGAGWLAVSTMLGSQRKGLWVGVVYQPSGYATTVKHNDMQCTVLCFGNL